MKKRDEHRDGQVAMNAGDPKNIISYFCREFHNALTMICSRFAGQLFRVQDLSQSGDGGLRKRFTRLALHRVSQMRDNRHCAVFMWIIVLQ
jgi:hypothetical protein